MIATMCTKLVANEGRYQHRGVPKNVNKLGQTRLKDQSRSYIHISTIASRFYALRDSDERTNDESCLCANAVKRPEFDSHLSFFNPWFLLQCFVK